MCTGCCIEFTRIDLLGGFSLAARICRLKSGGTAMSSGQPCKKQRLDEPAEPTSSVLTFFSDGSFRRIPVAKDAEAVPRNKKQITTVFAADGRYVHLQKPDPIEMQQSGCSAQKHSSESAGTWGLCPLQSNVASTGKNPGDCSTATQPFASGLSDAANMLSSQAPKSWLDSRLERARSLPPPLVKLDPPESRKSQGSANVMVELRVAQRSPTNSTESAARLRINASSTEALDKVLTESVGSLLSAMKPLP